MQIPCLTAAYRCRWPRHPRDGHSCVCPSPGFCTWWGPPQCRGSWHCPGEPGRFRNRSRSWCVQRRPCHNLSVGTLPGHCWGPSHHRTLSPSFPGSRSPPDPGRRSDHSSDGWCHHLNQEKDGGICTESFLMSNSKWFQGIRGKCNSLGLAIHKWKMRRAYMWYISLEEIKTRAGD